MGLIAAVIGFIIGNAGLSYFVENIIPEQMYKIGLAVPIMVFTFEFLILGACWILYKEGNQ